MAQNDWSAYYEAAGKKYNVDPRLLAAIVGVESSGNPNAIGVPTPYGRAQGAAQLLPSTAKALGVSDPMDPQQAISGAAKLLSENLDRYGNVTDAVKAYYGGTDQNNWGPKTAAYPGKVAARYSSLAPMQERATMPQQQNISDADLIAALTGGATPVTGNGGASSAQQMSDADLIKALTGGAQSAKTPNPQAAPIKGPRWGFTQELLDLPTFGTADEILSAGGALGKTLSQLASGESMTPLDNYNAILPQTRAAKAQYEKDNPLLSTVAQIGGLALGAPAAAGAKAIPSLTQIGGRVGDAIASATGKPLVGKIAGGALSGGVGGSLYGFGAGEGGLDNRLQSAKDLGIAGATIGGSIPAVAGLGRETAKALSGGGVNPLRADLAQTAIDKYGIPIRGSQISESPFIQWTDSVLGKTPLSGYASRNEKAGGAFTKAVAKTFGEDADNLTPEVMLRAKKRIGGVFNDVSSRTDIADAPETVLKPIGKVINQAFQEMPENEVAPLLKQLENIGSVINPETGTLSGKSYKALTAYNSPLGRATRSPNSGIRYYASQIRGALDDALQGSAAPEDLAALKEARLQYKNMKTVEDLAAKANIEGEISPQALLGAVKKSYKDMAYTGAGDIGELAKIGKEFLTPKPSPGTAEHYMLYRLLEGAGRAASHGIGAGAVGSGIALGAYTNPAITIPALAGTLAAGRAAGSALGSNWYRDLLLRSAAKQGSNALQKLIASPTGQALIANAPLVGAVEGNRLLGAPRGSNPQ